MSAVLNRKTIETRVANVSGELARNRQEAIDALRRGDLMKVAQLTTRAAELNRILSQADAQLSDAG